MASQEPPGAPSPRTGQEQDNLSDIARRTLAAVASETQVSQPQAQSSVVAAREATSTIIPTGDELPTQAEVASLAQGESITRKRKKKSRTHHSRVTPSEPTVQTTGDANSIAGSCQVPSAQTAMSERRRGKLPMAARSTEPEQAQSSSTARQSQATGLAYLGKNFIPQGGFSKGQRSGPRSGSGPSRQGQTQSGAARYGPSTSGPSRRPSRLFPWQERSSQDDATHVESARPGPSSGIQPPLADATEVRSRRKRKEAEKREYVAGQLISDGYIAIQPGTIQHAVERLDAARLAMQAQFHILKRIIHSITDELVRERRISRSLLQAVIERSAQADSADIAAFFEEGRHLSPNLTPLLQRLNEIVRWDPFPVIEPSVDQSPRRARPPHQSTQAARPLSPELGDLIDVLVEPTLLDTRDPRPPNAHAQVRQHENRPTVHEDDQNNRQDADEKGNDGEGPNADDDKVKW